MDLGVLIPIIAVGTGFVAVFGRVILRPILQSLSQQHSVANPRVQQLEEKISQLEARLAGAEVSVDSLLEERDFMRKLNRPQTDSSASGGPRN
jgi:hypothetical protein